MVSLCRVRPWVGRVQEGERNPGRLQGLAAAAGWLVRPVSPVGGCERSSLWGQGTTLSLAMDPLRCLLEIQWRNMDFVVQLSMHHLTHPLLMGIWVVSRFRQRSQCRHQPGLRIGGCAPEGWLPGSGSTGSKGVNGFCFSFSLYCQVAVQKASINLYFHQKCTRMSNFTHSCQQWVLSIF